MQKPTTKNFYLEHLAIVNNTNEVLASEDIRNDQGTLLVAKGTQITPDVSRKIAHHKLLKPVENSVTVESLLSAKQITQQFIDIPKASEFIQVQEQIELSESFYQCCKVLTQYPLIMQKLTVLSDRLPNLYSKSLLTAYMGLAISRDLKLSNESTLHVFLASMTKDLGVLHIDPNVVLKKGHWSAQEVRLLQGHVVISHFFLTKVPKLPKQVARAVLEHHERTDGLGYPYGKVGDDLCVEGQVVGISETVLAVANKQLRQGYSMRVVIPVIQLNETIHFVEVSQAAVRILRGLTSRCSRAYEDKDIPALIEKLIRSQPSLISWVQNSSELVAELSESYKGKYVRISYNLLTHIKAALVSSGIVSNEIQHWLENELANGTSEDNIEIECVAVMINEMSWQFRKLNNTLALAIENLDVTDKVKENLMNRNTLLEQFLNDVSVLDQKAA